MRFGNGFRRNEREWNRFPWRGLNPTREILNKEASSVTVSKTKPKMAMLESVIVEDTKDIEKPINREKTCPLLLRVFCSTGRHNSLQEYSNGNVPANELQIYTWMDATLKELSGLVKEVNPDARRHGTVFDFSLVYPDKFRGYRAKAVGTTVSQQATPDDNKTLAQLRFTIGDYLDIAITPPSRVIPMRNRRY